MRPDIASHREPFNRAWFWPRHRRSGCWNDNIQSLTCTMTVALVPQTSEGDLELALGARYSFIGYRIYGK